MWRCPKQRTVHLCGAAQSMVFDLRGTGPYNGLSSYEALASKMIDFCTVIKGCSFLFF